LFRVCPICNAILAKADAVNLETPVPDEPEFETTATGSGSAEGECAAPADRPNSPPENSANCDASASSWNCTNCGESVPSTFEICWNCGASLDGTIDPNFPKDSADKPPTRDDDDQFDSDAVTGSKVKECPRCGSTRMIVGAPVVDLPGNRIMVAVSGDPKALVFKQRLYVKLWADVCGDCGNAELRAEHFGDLYDVYLKSRRAND
jgi:hypothetical protein